jgi:hypothetical protein
MRPFMFYSTVLTALIPCTAVADPGSIFCGRNAFFSERMEPNGSLTFSYMGSDARQQIMTIEGVAAPHNSGWRFQQKSDKNPDERCTLDIVGVAGGFKMHTIEGARCVSSGGSGADMLLYDASFPSSMRVKGIAPLVDGEGHFQDFDCEKKTFYASRYEPSPAQRTAAAADAETVIRSVVGLDQGQRGELFAEEPTPLMKKYFSPGFVAAWANAMKHNGEEPVMDGDPISGWQGVTGISVKSFGPAKTVDVIKVIVSANLSVHTEGETKAEAVSFTLKRENDVMRIDDIADPNMPSMRAYFKTNYGL